MSTKVERSALEWDEREQEIARLGYLGFYEHFVVPMGLEPGSEAKANFDFYYGNLRQRYGGANVTLAYPTKEMIAAHPEYGGYPHVVLMVRPTEEVPPVALPSPQETDAPEPVEALDRAVIGELIFNSLQPQ